MPEIRVDHLAFAYGGKKILADISFVVPEGSVVVLTGPSGGGKTTLLRLLAGFLRPDAGHIYFDGKRVSAPSALVPPRRRGIGMVFQTQALWPHLSVKKHLSLQKNGGSLEKLLDMTGLKGKAGHKPDALSGGQRQRLAIARALSSEPSLLLLDEPFNQLDPPYRLEMNRLLHDICKGSKTTVLFVTHNINEMALPISGCLLLEDGRMQGPGPVFETLASSGSHYAKLLSEWLH